MGSSAWSREGPEDKPHFVTKPCAHSASSWLWPLSGSSLKAGALPVDAIIPRAPGHPHLHSTRKSWPSGMHAPHPPPDAGCQPLAASSAATPVTSRPPEPGSELCPITSYSGIPVPNLNCGLSPETMPSSRPTPRAPLPSVPHCLSPSRAPCPLLPIPVSFPLPVPRSANPSILSPSPVCPASYPDLSSSPPTSVASLLPPSSALLYTSPALSPGSVLLTPLSPHLEPQLCFIRRGRGETIHRA